ncbi:MAG: DNA polymerase III subunit delta [Alphaproteobacteria bacterium]|jgi:DNA polymerase-3 subunit delta|nr:DNA polymerase III subunit delta [Alphaproteobacteria bacterium]
MPALYASKLPEALQGPLPLVVLLWGDEAGGIRQAAQLVANTVASRTGLALDDPFGVETLTLPDLAAEPSRLTDACLTLAFTSPHKLVWLKGVSGTERAEEVKQLTEAVLATLQHPLQGVTLLLPIPGHLDKKHALVKTLEGQQGSLAVRFFSDTGRDLESFLKAELARHNANATNGALQLLAAGLGADREIARREVEKLVCYAGAEQPMTEAHVQASLCGATPSGVFLLAEAVLAQNTAKVDTLLDQLQEQGEDLNGALVLTLGELTKLAKAQALRAAGEADEAILAQCGKGALPPAAKQAFLAASRRYPAARLAQVPERALDALQLARSGLLPSDHVLARALLSWSV